METNAVKMTVKGVISPRDEGLKKLMREYMVYKKVLIPKVQKAVRQIVKDKSINVYAQQKWMVDKKLNEYLKNLPFHPMPFHNQSVWLENNDGKFLIHFKTRQGEAICHLNVPAKYHSLILRCSKRVAACSTGHSSSPLRESENLPSFGAYSPIAFTHERIAHEISDVKPACKNCNGLMYKFSYPTLGQVELIEDKKYGWVNCHITLRLPKPKPYEPKGWVGVDVGWNKLATSIFAACNPHLKFSKPTFHGKKFKTRIIQLRYLLKQYARKGKAWKKWRFRLNHTIKNAVGNVAKEIVSKAKKLKAGVSMEQLTFKSTTKGYIIPRYKLMIAVKTLCEREGIPFKLVSAKNTSITCPKCNHKNKKNRNGEWFKCLKCGYQTDADLAGAMNIALKALTATQMEGRLA